MYSQHGSAKMFSFYVYVNGGCLIVNAVPGASDRLPGMCYFRLKNSNSPQNFCSVPAKADASLLHYCRPRHVGKSFVLN